MESLSKYQKESLNLNYIIGEVIGTGKFSTVYKCINKTSKKIYALKAVDLSKLSKNGSNTIRYYIFDSEMKAKYLKSSIILKFSNIMKQSIQERMNTSSRSTFMGKICSNMYVNDRV